MPATREKVMAALYCHGPCGFGTVAKLVDEHDGERLSFVLRELGPMVSQRTVALPGLGVEPVTLLYLRGNGVG
jgi:hypothetical protein